ncbi:MAG TPA: hypothetical protein VF583_23915 [Bradyrhizobium sp.]
MINEADFSAMALLVGLGLGRPTIALSFNGIAGPFPVATTRSLNAD